MPLMTVRYHHEKFMEQIKLFSTRLNIPKLIRACDEQQHKKELINLYIQYDKIDNVATIIIAVRVANVEHPNRIYHPEKRMEHIKHKIKHIDNVAIQYDEIDNVATTVIAVRVANVEYPDSMQE
ncbi:hypothetical protein Ddye_001619 [Dipteronia dyeriana]|uniref:Uncharacterized protein n=1 Tax=Dipteronia dyeriana TaxID=168575 RepID=A0AAD9XP83_9ROSI|nr:hypothetical protein Ddye_001619 [Dipteronia dyeriana]